MAPDITFTRILSTEGHNDHNDSVIPYPWINGVFIVFMSIVASGDIIPVARYVDNSITDCWVAIIGILKRRTVI